MAYLQTRTKSQRSWGKLLWVFSLACCIQSGMADNTTTLTNPVGPVPAVQQTQKIKGIVKDESGEPLMGVSVAIKGTTTGVPTGLDGDFTLNCKKGDVLVFSYLGFITQEVTVGSQPTLTVVMKEDTEILGEVVVTAFGSTQKRASVVGSIQTVKPKELKVPSANLSTSFAGRMAGVIAFQRSGQPGADGASFYIRGISTFSGVTSPLIILDGVQVSQGDLNALDPEVIDGFQILKDATATAMYGTLGANGVMIVTTKTGRDLDKPEVNFRAEASVAQPTKIPKLVDGVSYMNMFNEAVRNSSTGDRLYTADQMYGTANGLNQYIYPNVDWYGEMFKNSAWSEKFNLNVRGGGKKVTYFTNVAVTHETGMLKNRSKEYFSFDNNLDIWRYTLQNNVVVNVTPTTVLAARLNVQLKDSDGPGQSTGSLFGQVMNANPVDYPIQFPDDANTPYTRWGGIAGGNYNINPMAELVSGYKSEFESTVIASVDLDQKLDFITKGLSFKGMISFKNYSYSQSTRTSPYNLHQLASYKQDENGDYTYELDHFNGENNVVLSTSGGTSGDRRLYIQAYLNYQRTFGKHDVSGMFLYNQDEVNVNNPSDLYSSLARRKQGLAARVSYAYDGKYMVEFNGGYNGSENFAEGHRFGFFPSIAVGYNISDEAFFEKIRPVLSRLKVRGSWGIVGNDQIGSERFIYLANINLQSSDPNRGYTTGINQNYTLYGPNYTRYQNNEITWETGQKINIGVDLQLFKKLNLTVDIFQEKRKNIFQSLQTIPTYLGTASTTVYGNLGKVRNRGIDGSIDYTHQVNKDLNITMKGTFTFARNKVVEKSEPNYRQYPNLSQVGKRMNLYLGYIADRLFIDPAEIANSPEQTISSPVLPGDIKYKNIADVNGEYDNVINGNDRVYMGNPDIPEITYGFGPSIQWKKFDFSVFFQGVANTSLMMSGFYPFGSTERRNVLQFIADDYWSDSNQNIYAAYPRLSKISSSNNTTTSSYWLRNAAFLKLKNAEIGYNATRKIRVYVSGNNLVTFSPFDLWDPEMGGGSGLSYPTQRVINFGVQFAL